MRNSAVAYGSVTKFFHWLIFLLLGSMLIYGYFLEDVPKEYQGLAYNIHKLMGLFILCLMLLRGLWAFVNPKPLLPMGTPSWQRWAERLVHFLLYGVIIAMPIAGWIGASAAGHPPHVGSVDLSLPIQKSKWLDESAFSVHNTLAIIIIVLISAHVLAALYHHFIKKDNILRRMLPGGGTYS